MQNTLTITLTDDQIADLSYYMPLASSIPNAEIEPIKYLNNKINHELSVAKEARSKQRITKIISALNQANDATVAQVSQTLNIVEDVTPTP